MKTKSVNPLGWAVLILGLGLLVAGVVSAMRTRSFMAHSAAATATVLSCDGVDSVEQADGVSRHVTLYKPRFSFVDGSGQTVSVLAKWGDREPKFTVGQQLPVLYDPADPTGARIRNFSSLWMIATILCGLGVVLTAAGAKLLITKPRSIRG